MATYLGESDASFLLYHVPERSCSAAGIQRQLKNTNYLGESFPPGGSHFILRLE